MEIKELVFVDRSTQTSNEEESQLIINQLQMNEQIKQKEILQKELDESKKLVKSLQDIINVLIEYDDNGPIQHTDTKRQLSLPYKVHEREWKQENYELTLHENGNFSDKCRNSADMSNQWMYSYHVKPNLVEFLNSKGRHKNGGENQRKLKNFCSNRSYNSYSSFSKLLDGGKLFFLLVGDSLVKHITGSELKEHCGGADFMVRGMKKGKIKHVKRFIIDALDMMKPDYVCLHVSKDDVTSGRTLAMIKSDMEDLLMYIIDLGKKPIISMMVMRNDVHRYKVNVVNDMLRSLCLKLGVRYVQHKNIRSEHLCSNGIQLKEQYGYLFRDNLLFCFYDVLQKEEMQNTDA